MSFVSAKSYISRQRTIFEIPTCVPMLLTLETMLAPGAKADAEAKHKAVNVTENFMVVQRLDKCEEQLVDR
jgi:hypothetical protein